MCERCGRRPQSETGILYYTGLALFAIWLVAFVVWAVVSWRLLSALS